MHRMRARLSKVSKSGFVARRIPVVARVPECAASIDNAIVGYCQGTLTIFGMNFGASPQVRVGPVRLEVRSVNSRQVVAAFPGDAMPATFTPGTYLLTISFRTCAAANFEMSMGAPGPMGPPGPNGAVACRQNPMMS